MSRYAAAILCYTISCFLPHDVDAVPGRRLTTSFDCRVALDDMLRNEIWMFVNNSQTRWCRIIVENEFANCCNEAEFAKGKAEGCSDCLADCSHHQMHTVCATHFGRACPVWRKPFARTGAPGLEVLETFCLPEACDNSGDRLAILPWFDSTYRSRRISWHLWWDQAELDCPPFWRTVLLWSIFSIVMLGCLGKVGQILFIAPPERGRTLVSQQDMAGSDDEDEDEEEEDATRSGLRQIGDAGKSGY